MTEQQTQQATAAEATPRAAGAITPTPTPHEINALITQVATGTQPRLPWFHSMDGSAIDPQSPDPTNKTTTWP
jgi:hypothetical protein